MNTPAGVGGNLEGVADALAGLLSPGHSQRGVSTGDEREGGREGRRREGGRQQRTRQLTQTNSILGLHPDPANFRQSLQIFCVQNTTTIQFLRAYYAEMFSGRAEMLEY